jgi:hypothetical protein
VSYESQLQKFQTLGMGAISRLVTDNAELFLSVSEEEAAKKIVALTRLRANELPEPHDENEMYDILAALFGELLAQGQINIAPYGLSVMGHNQREELIRRASGEVLPQPDPYAEVVRLYKTNVSEFNDRRTSDPDFLERSNAAQAAGLLR